MQRGRTRYVRVRIMHAHTYGNGKSPYSEGVEAIERPVWRSGL